VTRPFRGKSYVAFANGNSGWTMAGGDWTNNWVVFQILPTARPGTASINVVRNHVTGCSVYCRLFHHRLPPQPPVISSLSVALAPPGATVVVAR
jgi:hypothetical protein